VSEDEMKNSIEEIFGLKVESVRVLNTKFKNKRTRLGKYKLSYMY
jgi:ribosomal protein L23